jgi:hypothetical protein
MVSLDFAVRATIDTFFGVFLTWRTCKLQTEN